MSYNTSDSSIIVQAQLSSSISSYTVSGEPGRTYYITVFAVNAVGTGAISDYSIVTGEMIYTNIDCILHCYTVPLLLTITPTTATTSGQIVQTNPVMLTSFSTNQVTSTAS